MSSGCSLETEDFFLFAKNRREQSVSDAASEAAGSSVAFFLRKANKLLINR